MCARNTPQNEMCHDIKNHRNVSTGENLPTQDGVWQASDKSVSGCRPSAGPRIQGQVLTPQGPSHPGLPFSLDCSFVLWCDSFFASLVPFFASLVLCRSRALQVSCLFGLVPGHSELNPQSADLPLTLRVVTPVVLGEDPEFRLGRGTMPSPCQQSARAQNETNDQATPNLRNVESTHEHTHTHTHDTSTQARALRDALARTHMKHTSLSLFLRTPMGSLLC